MKDLLKAIADNLLQSQPCPVKGNDLITVMVDMLDSGVMVPDDIMSVLPQEMRRGGLIALMAFCQHILPTHVPSPVSHPEPSTAPVQNTEPVPNGETQ